MITIELKDSDFEKIRKLIYEQCGINLHDGKRELVKARLGKRLRQGNYKSFSDYCRYVVTDEGTDELIAMIDSISTNLTSFFREESHFVRLRFIISTIMEKAGPRGFHQRFNIWSAGCSTGEEPYSLAITIRETIGSQPFDAKIIATDISTKVLHIAESAIYPAEKVKGIDVSMLKKYFQIGSGHSEGYYRIKKDIKDMIEFKRFNLMHRFPSDSHFDVIFCRNVMIYFDKKTQNDLINKFYNSLKTGGCFFVGHSESLTGLKHQFKYVEPSVYQK
jgi:chemotaxis protein methyltransferase CheR